jgi:hypothetical protein
MVTLDAVRFVPRCISSMAYLALHEKTDRQVAAQAYRWLFTNTTTEFSRSSDSVVGVATGYGLDDREVGVRAPVGARIFSFPCHPDRLWDRPNLLYNGYRGFFPGLKRQGLEADHSSPTSAEIKKMWIYTSTPPYTFMT